MILDCFMFFNEVDILEGRLEYLYNTVDYFVIVETNVTHSGKSKPLNYLANIDRFKPYLDKILYFPFAADVTGLDFSYKPEVTEDGAPQWVMENMQRSYISKALDLFDDSAIVLISDADEIPNREVLPYAISTLPEYKAVSLEQQLFYYNFNQIQPMPWTGTVVTTNGFAKQQTPQQLRNLTMRGQLAKVPNSGWHLSYWGSPEKIAHKIQNFAHQELNKANFTDVELIKNRIANGLDPYDRQGLQPFDPSTLPADVLNIFGKYSKTVSVAPNSPMPHFCLDIPGFFGGGDFLFLKKMVKDAPSTAHFVEVGSFKGRSSSYLAVEIINSKKDIKLDCVDTWLGSEEHQEGKSFEDPDVVNNRLFEAFLSNMKPVEGHYTPVRATSVEAAALYEDNSLDFVFIDAGHEYDDVTADINAWLPKIKVGGIISGHDYIYPPVRQAVVELLGIAPSIGTCWYMAKK